MTIIARTLPRAAAAAAAAATAALFIATPAAAQVPEKVDLMQASLASVLAICIGVLDGTVNLNDRAALAPYGLAPGTPGQEADFKARDASNEIAYAATPDGKVHVLASPRRLCLVRIEGETRWAVRDELVKQLLATGARSERSQSGGEDVVTVFFTNATIDVRTGATGTLRVVLKRVVS